MIIQVKFQAVLDKDTQISHQTEVVVDSEQEAYDRGAEFHRMMLAFNNGIVSVGDES